MFVLVLLFWLWPIWFSVIVTALLKAKLESPMSYLLKSIVMCGLIEVALASGLLQVFVVPVISLSGVFVHMLLGSAACFWLYRHERRRSSLASD